MTKYDDFDHHARDCGKTIDNLANKIHARKLKVRTDLQELYSILGGFLP